MEEVSVMGNGQKGMYDSVSMTNKTERRLKRYRNERDKTI